MFRSIHRPLGLLAFGLAALAILPMSGILNAQNLKSRSGFLPFQPNGTLRPNQQVIFGGNNGNNNNGNNNNGGGQQGFGGGGQQGFGGGGQQGFGGGGQQGFGRRR